MTATPTSPWATRLWTYQRERFPLARTAVLVATFSTAGIAVSARLGHRALPGWQTFATAFLVVLVTFFQMRACDEVKDRHDDMAFRPERPVPRGLVSLREVTTLAAVLAPPALLAALLLSPGVGLLLALVWAWLAAMTAEFGAPAFLRRHPLLYLVSHMAIMPLIDLFVTGCEWVPGGGPPPGLAAFLLLSFANGCVLELGRKVWAPASERPGVETYSALWGPRRAAMAWTGCVTVALALLAWTLAAEGAPPWILPVGGVAAIACGTVAGRFLRDATPATQSRVDGATGLWVLVCYVCAGLLPFLGGPT